MVERAADLGHALLTSHGIQDVFHYAPLHYVLFIARSKALFSKDALRRLGYEPSHFRSTSRRQDEARGFSNYVHLALKKWPDILAAKLCRGFPHFEIRVPAAHAEICGIHLCRYNIARSRNKRTGKRPPPQGPATGRYHGKKELPTAESVTECEELLEATRDLKKIEVLVPTMLPLNDATDLIFFSEHDRALAEALVRPMGVSWKLDVADRSYTSAARYVASVRQFLERTVLEPKWRGNGLEFDRV